MRAILIALAGLLFAALVPAVAEAQTDLEAARRHFDLAEGHFQARRFALAIEEYEASYALMAGHPNQGLIRYNIGRGREELGQARQAIAEYERFLAETPPSEPHRPEVQQRIQNLRLTLGPDDASGGADVVPAVIAFSVAGAALVSFGIFGGLALAEDGRIAELPCAAAMSCPDAELSDMSTFALVADISLGVAGAAAIAGVILLVTLGLDGGSDEVAVAPWVSPSAAGLAVGGRL